MAKYILKNISPDKLSIANRIIQPNETITVFNIEQYNNMINLGYLINITRMNDISKMSPKTPKKASKEVSLEVPVKMPSKEAPKEESLNEDNHQKEIKTIDITQLILMNDMQELESIVTDYCINRGLTKELKEFKSLSKECITNDDKEELIAFVINTIIK
jgi:hypothetical protein